MSFVLAAGLIQASHVVYYGFATLHWRAAGHGEAVIGWLWAEGVVAEIILFAWAAAVLRRLPPLRLLALAGGLTVLRWAATALSTDLAVLVPAQALHAASFGAVHLATVHYLRDRTPLELQASAQGFYAAIGGALLSGLLTPVGGWLYGRVGGGAFWAMAAIALAGHRACRRLEVGPEMSGTRAPISGARSRARDGAASRTGRCGNACRTRMRGGCRAARSGQSWCNRRC